MCTLTCGPQPTIHLQIWPSGLKVCAPLIYMLPSFVVLFTRNIDDAMWYPELSNAIWQAAVLASM